MTATGNVESIMYHKSMLHVVVPKDVVEWWVKSHASRDYQYLQKWMKQSFFVMQLLEQHPEFLTDKAAFEKTLFSLTGYARVCTISDQENVYIRTKTEIIKQGEESLQKEVPPLLSDIRPTPVINKLDKEMSRFGLGEKQVAQQVFHKGKLLIQEKDIEDSVEVETVETRPPGEDDPELSKDDF